MKNILHEKTGSPNRMKSPPPSDSRIHTILKKKRKKLQDKRDMQDKWKVKE